MKITLNDVTNIDALSVINDNFDKIEQELQNKVLYRNNPDGEPNPIEKDIDVNGKNLLNVGEVFSSYGRWATIDEVEEIKEEVLVNASQVSTDKTLTLGYRNSAEGFLNSTSALYDSFDDRYLGVKASDPTADNDGNTLTAGALYFRSSGSPIMRVYNGTTWQDVGSITSTTTNMIDGTLYSNQTEAEQGINNTKVMTPLSTKQAIDKQVKEGFTTTGAIILPGDTVNALGAVPKQQLDAIARLDLASLSVTVSSNAITCTLPSEVLNFRSSTANDGSAVARTASPTILTVPSGATLGTANGVSARIVWGLIDNAGTPEPFVINAGGSANLDESTLISTTAISGASNSPNVFYSQTARSNVAYKIRGWCDITQATAGIWATAPTRVCGASNQTLKAIQGRVRTPQNMLPFRSFGVTYTNTNSYEIFVHINILWTSGAGAARLTVDGINFDGPVFSGVNQTSQVNVPVPPGSSYTLSGTNSIGFAIIGWNEVR